MRIVSILLLLFSGSALYGEELLKLLGGGEILVKRDGNKLLDCRGKTVSVKGSLVPTDDRCPDPVLEARTLPRTASNWMAAMLIGVILTSASLILLLIRRRSSRIESRPSTLNT